MLFKVNGNDIWITRPARTAFLVEPAEKDPLEIPVCQELGPAAALTCLSTTEDAAAAKLLQLLQKIAPPEGAFSATTAEQILMQRPFPVEAIKFRQGSFGKQLPHIDPRDVFSRLNMVVGPTWSRQVELVSQRDLVVTIPATAKREERQALMWHVSAITTLQVNGQTVSALGTGKSEDYELAYKDADSDSLKRASFLLGVGTYLYHLNASKNESIPIWALPEAFDLFYPA